MSFHRETKPYLKNLANLQELKQPKNRCELNKIPEGKRWRREAEKSFPVLLKEMDDYKNSVNEKPYNDNTWGLLRFIRNALVHRDLKRSAKIHKVHLHSVPLHSLGPRTIVAAN
ncbi:hypothetical protein NFI96_032157 [Prochilodus magdalenae]|nr:hypothetical protein NFI96_032157 [Prochilodus magdalenae]